MGLAILALWAPSQARGPGKRKRRARVTVAPPVVVRALGRGSGAPGWACLGAEGLAPFGGHGGDDPLEIVQGGELDHDLSLVAAEFYFDLGVEDV